MITKKFEVGILSYLVQGRDAYRYGTHIPSEFFSDMAYALVFEMILSHFKDGLTKIPKVSLNQQLVDTSDDLEDTHIDPYDIAGIIKKIYEPISTDELKVYKNRLIEDVKEFKMNALLEKFAAGEINADDFGNQVARVKSEMYMDSEDLFDYGGFLAADAEKFMSLDFMEGKPTFLHALNNLTAAKGFHTPQLIIIMSGPKHFKTGLLLKLALEYMKAGEKIYYADAENGVRDIRNRLKMIALECSYEELSDPEMQEEAVSVLKRITKMFGGDIYIDGYQANKSSISDVEARLSQLREQFDFVPTIIFYDSIDHFTPSLKSDQTRDLRHKISIVYHEAVSLNKRLGSFSIAPSQVNRAAVGKSKFDMKDVSESFDKIMNCHAAFAICATNEELDMGVRRIIPVAQRQGTRYKGDSTTCMIHIDEEKHVIKEVAIDQLNSDVDDQ